MTTRRILLTVLTAAALVAALHVRRAPTPPPPPVTTSSWRARSTSPSTDADRCDPIAPAGCLLPFPNDHFTVADDTTPHRAAGRARPGVDAGQRRRRPHRPGVVERARRVQPRRRRPASRSPTSTSTASGTAPITDIAASLDDDAPIVLLDADTGERLPYWVERDSYAEGTDEVPTTFVRPAVSLPEGHRIVVGRARPGRRPPASPSRRPTRSAPSATGSRPRCPELEDRRPSDGGGLRRPRRRRRRARRPAAGLGLHRGQRRGALVAAAAPCATTPSRRSATRRPRFTVDTVTPSDREGIATEVSGTYEVPLYLDGDGGPGSSLVDRRRRRAHPDRHLHRQLHLHRPDVGVSRRPGHDRAVRPRPARHVRPGARRLGDVAAAGQHRVLRHRPHRHGRGGHRQRRRRSSATCRRSTRCPTACCRATSTRCSSAAC